MSPDRGGKTRGNPIPLYFQVEVDLRSRLKRGEFAPGDDFPSEKDLCDNYSVSRVTVRQALSQLQKDGLIDRRPGKGTTVTNKVTTINLHKFTGALEDAIFRGLGPKYEAELVDFYMAPPDPKVAENLDLDPKAEMLHIKRVRLAGGSPMAYLHNCLPREIGSRLAPEDVLARPILNNLEKKLGLSLHQADEIIEATMADARMAELLGVMVGDPLLKMTRTTYGVDGEMLNHVVILFRADKYSFRVRLKRGTLDKKNDWSLA